MLDNEPIWSKIVFLKAKKYAILDNIRNQVKKFKSLTEEQIKLCIENNIESKRLNSSEHGVYVAPIQELRQYHSALNCDCFLCNKIKEFVNEVK